MAITATDLAAHLRLNPDSTDDVAVYLAAAQSKARTAGIRPFASNAQYDMFILQLASYLFDNRAFTNRDTADGAQQIINSFVLELRYAEEDVEESES